MQYAFSAVRPGEGSGALACQGRGQWMPERRSSRLDLNLATRLGLPGAPWTQTSRVLSSAAQ
jgi:hypothetical protein